MQTPGGLMYTKIFGAGAIGASSAPFRLSAVPIFSSSSAGNDTILALSAMFAPF